MDRANKQVLEILQHEGRIKIADLAERISLSPTPCARRVRQLEESGVIRGYAALLNQSAIGLAVNALVSVRLEKKTDTLMSQFEQQIVCCPEVMVCYLMTGSFDYLMRVATPDLASYEAFMSRKLTSFPGVMDIQTRFALRQVAYRTAFPLDQVGVLDGG
jgi:Lrp/AsnC family leucine-responsive transcriptional regulator